MSGFEIVGVVLGTIPLIISALEHYNESAVVISRLLKPDRPRRALIRFLGAEKTHLEIICETILIGLVPISQIETMIQNPGGKLWQDKKLQTKLHRRLGTAVGLFDSYISNIERSVGELIDRLGVDPEDPHQLMESSPLQRIRFAFSSSTYADLTASIRENLVDLNRLVDSSRKLEAPRQERREVDLLMLLRELSRSLYQALDKSLPCSCSHTINLKLTMQSSDVMFLQSESERLENLELQILVSDKKVYQPSSSASELNQDWWGLRCYAIAAKQKEQEASIVLQDIPYSKVQSKSRKAKATGEQVAAKTSPSPRSFSKNTSILMETSTTQVASLLVPGLLGKSTEQQIKKIENLCEEISKSVGDSINNSGDSYGVISESDAQAARQYKIYPARLAEQVPIHCKIVSLRDVWQDLEAFPFMTCRDRYQLAVTVASSCLQLQDTPWIPNILTAEEIFFVQNNTTPMYDSVFIWRAMGQDAATTVGRPRSLLESHRNSALLALGILLVEIFFKRPLGNDGGQETGTMERKFREAHDLLPRIRLESAKYSSAAYRCLDGELHTKGYDEAETREHAYAGIVALLKEELDLIT